MATLTENEQSILEHLVKKLTSEKKEKPKRMSDKEFFNSEVQRKMLLPKINNVKLI